MCRSLIKHKDNIQKKEERKHSNGRFRRIICLLLANDNVWSYFLALTCLLVYLGDNNFSQSLINSSSLQCYDLLLRKEV